MQIGQMRYRIGGDDATTTDNLGDYITSDTSLTNKKIYNNIISTGDTFTKLSIQAPSGTEFFINDTSKVSAFEIGSAGFYNVLKDINITNLCFAPKTYYTGTGLDVKAQRHYILLNEGLNILFKLQKKALLNKTYIILSENVNDINYGATSDVDLSFFTPAVETDSSVFGTSTDYYLTSDKVLNAMLNGNFIVFPILQEIIWQITAVATQDLVTLNTIRSLFFNDITSIETNFNMSSNEWRGKKYDSATNAEYSASLKNLINTYTTLYQYNYNTYYNKGFMSGSMIETTEDLKDIIIDYLK